MSNRKTNTDTERKSRAHGKDAKIKRRSLWTIVFIVIAVLTVWAITSQNKNFSFPAFRSFLANLNPVWLIAAILAMVAYIFLEGLAILTLCKALGYRRSVKQGYSYSAADIYFSAITPSATGGQPASAFFMIKDGIPASAVTAVLLLNLIMYTFSILALGLISFLFAPGMFGYFTTPSRILILVGIVSQLVLASFFILLLRRASVLRWIGTKGILLLKRLHLIRRTEKKLARMNAAMDSYESSVAGLDKCPRALALTFLFNFLQRATLILVSVFTFLAASGALPDVGRIFCGECMVILGYNFVPIPGAMGVADGLILDVFTNFLGDGSLAANLEFLSRSISFYLCVIVCGLSFLFRCVSLSLRKKGASAENQNEKQEKTEP